MTDQEMPKGELAIQTIAMPADANANGDVFGGWIISQMDLAGGAICKKLARTRVVTVAIDSMTFKTPVHIGDAVGCYVEIKKIGSSSMTVEITAWSTSFTTGKQRMVTNGTFVYVAIDEDHNPMPVNRP